MSTFFVKNFHSVHSLWVLKCFPNILSYNPSFCMKKKIKFQVEINSTLVISLYFTNFEGLYFDKEESDMLENYFINGTPCI